MDVKPERTERLRRLCRDNGVDIDASDGLQRLNRWFLQAVEPSDSDDNRLASRWYSVVNDIGILLGERAIAESGGKLRWEFFTWGKSDAAYQRHVIMGFDVPNPKFNIDFDLRIAQYAHRILKGVEVEPDFFVRMLDNALSKVNR